MASEDFEAAIRPFVWVDHGGHASVILTVGSYLQEIFDARADEGFEGNGYDWTSLAQVFLAERLPELVDTIRFDPEADMFAAYSDDADALRSFVTLFKATCEDEALIRDLFSRAELD